MSNETITISKTEYEKLLHSAVLLDLYEDACNQSAYPKYLYKCSFDGCEAMCLRDSRDYDGYYKCNFMETCEKCENSFCDLHGDGFDDERNRCKKCVEENPIE